MSYRYADGKWFFGDDMVDNTELAEEASIPDLPPNCVAVWAVDGKVFWSDGTTQRALPASARAQAMELSRNSGNVMNKVRTRRDMIRKEEIRLVEERQRLEEMESIRDEANR